MSDKSKIEWCDATWNPVTGCTKVSEGCRNCYAKTFTERFEGTPGHYFESGFAVTLRPERLDQPLRWKRPRRIFVNSMSDLFHEDIPNSFIDKVFAVMSLAPQHTFQILTKRPERMLQYLSHENRAADIWYFRDQLLDDELRFASGPFKRWNQEEFHSGAVVESLFGYEPGIEQWPLPNVWLGVSVENQQSADERIPLLLETPAAIRFLSCEPLLGSIDLRQAHLAPIRLPRVDWVIVGGESGPGARPMHPEWARSLRDQCQAAGVAFHFKQWGEWAPGLNFPDFIPSSVSASDLGLGDDLRNVWKVGKKAAGRLLDGREWNEFPEVQP